MIWWVRDVRREDMLRGGVRRMARCTGWGLLAVRRGDSASGVVGAVVLKEGKVSDGVLGGVM